MQPDRIVGLGAGLCGPVSRYHLLAHPINPVVNFILILSSPRSRIPLPRCRLRKNLERKASRCGQQLTVMFFNSILVNDNEIVDVNLMEGVGPIRGEHDRALSNDDEHGKGSGTQVPSSSLRLELREKPKKSAKRVREPHQPRPSPSNLQPFKFQQDRNHEHDT